MNTSISMARAGACLLLAAFSVHAQAHAQHAGAASAADPQAAVPATIYKPAMAYQAPGTPATTADRNWVASNETVAVTNSMQLTMKPRANQSGDPHAGHAMPQAAPTSQANDPHAGHAMPRHDHQAMHGMPGTQTGGESGGMCKPGAKGEGQGQGMQCMQNKDGQGKDGKMACCESGCGSGCCCGDKMKHGDSK